MEIQSNIIENIISRYGPTSVFADQFFISWNSVATLAYKGFSKTLMAVKRDIEKEIPGLKAENPGSLWPKTTIGCLKEGVELSEGQLKRLRSVCLNLNVELQRLSDPDRSMTINELSFVTFHCRTLERRLSSQRIPLKGRYTHNDSPPPTHIDAVSKIMAQFEARNHDSYYPKLAAQGRTINMYYRKPHIESTLVYDLKASSALCDIIGDFCQAIDKTLPDCYAWFDPDSRHMTIRAILY